MALHGELTIHGMELLRVIEVTKTYVHFEILIPGVTPRVYTLGRGDTLALSSFHISLPNIGEKR